MQELDEGDMERLRGGQGDPDEGAVVAAELAGPLVRAVVEVGRRLEDPFAGGGTGARDAAEDGRDQRPGDAGTLGNIAHGGRPPDWVGHQAPRG